MAHVEQQDFVERVKLAFPEYFAGGPVLEIGSRIINGTVRACFAGGAYTGIDLTPGPGVDRVCHAREVAARGWYDTVISCEALEHDAHWRETLEAIPRLLRPGGLIVITCATDGRREHGTAAREPDSSPATNDHYRNLRPDDFTALQDACRRWTMEVYPDHGDLYFAGLTRPEEAR